tara:strand:- start:2243 stop:2473 length:231 start_codon:yes stop_codon:yes gene_type:complete
MGSRLSKEERQWRRTNRKITREHNRDARRTEGTRLAQAIRRARNKKKQQYNSPPPNQASQQTNEQYYDRGDYENSY